MLKKLNKLVVSLTLLSAVGCSSSVNKTLSPPKDTKWVNVEIKNPSPYTKPLPLEIRYISYECQNNRVSGADGSIIAEPSYTVINMPLNKQEDDTWRGQVEISGGGSCDWKLSAITLGIKYIETDHIGNGLVPGTSVGVMFAFDDDASRNGQFDIVPRNKIALSPNYYPLIKTNKMVHRTDTLSLFGKEDFLQVKLGLGDASKEIVFSPEIDESKLVKMVAPEKYKVGEFFKIIYPNGVVISDGSTHPDIRKLTE